MRAAFRYSLTGEPYRNAPPDKVISICPAKTLESPQGTILSPYDLRCTEIPNPDEPKATR
jgi:hypothetical protein